MEQLSKNIIALILITFLALGLFSAANSHAALAPIESAGYYKQLDVVSSKIASNPKAYKKDRPKGYAWAKKNLTEGLKNIKVTIWKRYDVRLADNAVFEKAIYDRLVYNEAIRHALSMATLDPLIKKSEKLVKKITRVQKIKCKIKWNKKLAKKNKKLAWKKYRKAKKKCNRKKNRKLYSLRDSLEVVNNELEPAKQQKISDHIAKTEEINNKMAEVKVATRNVANNSTIEELTKATKIANKGRARIGLSTLPMPAPKMSSVNPAQSEFWGMMTAGNINWARAAQSGVGTVRVNMMYAVAIRGQAKGKFAWGAQDSGFVGAAKAGIRITPTFYGDQTGGPNALKFGSPIWNSYTKFVKESVARYGPNGKFWKEHPTLPYMPVNTWSVWNEQNYSHNNYQGKGVGIGNYSKMLVGMS